MSLHPCALSTECRQYESLREFLRFSQLPSDNLISVPCDESLPNYLPQKLFQLPIPVLVFEETISDDGQEREDESP